MYHGRSHLRLLVLAMLVVAAWVTVSWRLWRVQIIDGPRYAAQLATRGAVRVRLAPSRGEIRDRNGIPLVENWSRTDIELYLPEMVQAYRARYGAVPMMSYVGHFHEMEKMMREPDIVQIVSRVVVPRLRQLGLPTAFNAEELERHFRIEAQIPFPWVENADFATAAKFSEHDLGLPGLRVTIRPIRRYVYGALAAHVLGYVGDPREIAELPDVGDYEFYEPNVEGKAEIERIMDPQLRGQPGVRVLQKGLKGAIEKELRVESPRQGDTVYLTLDARIQLIVEQALRAVGRAGAVVLDPNNGEVLAMASEPSFDPNRFVPRISAAEWTQLTKDEADPLVNRAISAYPPGSTFKIVTALAGLSRHLAKTPFTCTGGVSYGDHYFKCWLPSGHGRLTVTDAIKVSCNAFFYQYGNAAGIDAIDSIGKVLGIGEPSELGLSGEQDGALPGPAWLKNHAPQEKWSSAYTANVSIGQGYDLVSPLQLALAYSTVANGGTSYYPRLIGSVMRADGRPVDDKEWFALPTVPRIRGQLSEAGIGPAELELVRRGFWKVVNEDGGTGGRARLAGTEVAGKTGTAQAKRKGRPDTIAWFVCFVPYEHPRYTVCVMVQGGAHGGSVAAPLAAKIVEETLAMESGAYTPVLAPVSPSGPHDPFRMIESLNVQSLARTEGAPAVEKPAKIAEGPARAKKVTLAPFVSKPAPPKQNLIQWLFSPFRKR